MTRPLLRTIGVTIGVGVLFLAGVFGWRAYQARYWLTHWRDVTNGTVIVTVEPPAITPGGSLTLVGSFSNAYDFGLSTANAAVHVFDEQGMDRFFTPDERQGVMPRSDSGFAFPGDEGIGCPLMEPPTVGPRKYTDRAIIMALPKTPPGQYLLRLDPGAYCNGLPEQPVDLGFRVVNVLPE